MPLFFVPFSPEIRLAAIVWLTPGPCQFGCCGGAALIHARLVVPFLKKTEGKIDSRSALAFLAESSEQAVADAAVAARRFAAPMVATANEVVEDLTEQAKELREGLIESPAAAAAETPAPYDDRKNPHEVAKHLPGKVPQQELPGDRSRSLVEDGGGLERSDALGGRAHQAPRIRFESTSTGSSSPTRGGKVDARRQKIATAMNLNDM